MRVLVTGGAGFIGSHVVDKLVARGDEVTVVDNLDPQVHGPDVSEPAHLLPHLKQGAIRFIKGDVLDRGTVEKALEGVHGVAHLAAVVGVGQSMYEPFHYVNNNSAGTGQLLDVVAQKGKDLEKLVVASSMSLYGEGAYRCPDCGGGKARPREEARLQRGDWDVLCADCGGRLEPRPTPEEKPAEIASVYAATKKHQEDLVLSFGQAYGIPSLALRFFNVYGPRQSLSNPYTGVAAIFLSRLLNEKPPLVFEDGEQSRDFIYVEDVAEAVVRALDSSEPGAHAVNVGTGRSVSIREVAQVLANHLEKDLEPRQLNRFRAGDIRHCHADSSRAETILSFQCRWSFEDGIASLIEWSRNQRPVDKVEQCLAELEEHQLIQ